jgi:hypothetical protein
MKVIELLVPALITILANFLFYWYIKSRLDKSIEKLKISYSGIFKEKIEIYKTILSSLVDLKYKIQTYQYFGTADDGEKLMLEFNIFINFLQKSRPFLSDNILITIRQIQDELQTCLDDFYKYKALNQAEGIGSKTRIASMNRFFESGNKFKTNSPFSDLEGKIILEIRNDLQLNAI